MPMTGWMNKQIGLLLYDEILLPNQSHFIIYGITDTGSSLKHEIWAQHHAVL
jgi:hypothetical protein